MCYLLMTVFTGFRKRIVAGNGKIKSNWKLRYLYLCSTLRKWKHNWRNTKC